MINTGLSSLLATRFDMSKRGWKQQVCSAMHISRPTLNRYLSLERDGKASLIPDEFFSALLNLTENEEATMQIQSAYEMVNLLASGLCKLQEGIDKSGHIQSPYPKDLIRGLNIASALNLYRGKHYPTDLASLLSVASKPLYKWCSEYDGEHAEEFGAETLIQDGEITPACLSMGGICDVDPEEKFYKSLMEACDKLDEKSAQLFYVAWRKAVIENPITTGTSAITADKTLTQNILLAHGLQNIFYEPLSNIHAINNKVPLCPVSKTRLKKIHNEWVSESRDPGAAMEIRESGPLWIEYNPYMLELKRAARVYWALPGIQEVKLFNYAKSLNYKVELWPNMDAIDILISHRDKQLRYAVDLKEYRSSIRLANAFNGFNSYRNHKHLIIIPDYLSKITPDYLEQFERARRSKQKTEVTISTVSEFNELLRRGA